MTHRLSLIVFIQQLIDLIYGHSQHKFKPVYSQLVHPCSDVDYHSGV